MTDHLPECWATYPSDPAAWCICDELRACEQRIREDERSNNFTPDDHANGMTESYHRGFDAAREAVEAIPAPYKIRGDFETYGPYSKGRADFKDHAISAIDALREKQ